MLECTNVIVSMSVYVRLHYLDHFVINWIFWSALNHLDPFHVYLDTFHVYLDPFVVLFEILHYNYNSLLVTNAHLKSKLLPGDITTNYCYIFMSWV